MINYGLSAPNSKVLQSVAGVLQNGCDSLQQKYVPVHYIHSHHTYLKLCISVYGETQSMTAYQYLRFLPY
ncbi:hypothetical protein HZ326_12626 [Fusarium oxysporum f. sp. albedinis]|nr:hypothetical protein HZ326_12626 [Fusarium oxysporum f. sp. albedinis]